MKQDVRVVLVGMGGYGESYLGPLLESAGAHGAVLAAGVEPQPQRCKQMPDVVARSIPVFNSLADFYAGGGEADLVIIAAPIQMHRPLTEQALAHGANVLCEKPLCATIQEARSMLAAERAAGRFVAIGYQWSFSSAVQELKADIMAGKLGRPVSLRCVCCWPRSAAYYARNNWAGALKTASGDWVLDSPVNNATAHYLHNMLYLLGASRERSVELASVTAELYRANPITNYDTGMLRAITVEGAQILFLSSHAVPVSIGPLFHLDFEKAVVFNEASYSGGFRARFRDGVMKRYGSVDDGFDRKLWDCVDAVRTSARPACGIEAAAVQTLCMNGAQDSCGGVRDFPPELVVTLNESTEPLRTVNALHERMLACYDLGCLPAELGYVPWAKAGRSVELGAYTSFPSV